MDKLIVLGTGNGGALKCYNTCFALQKDEEYFLVDGGGGNGILANLKKANIDILKVHNIFISHNHTDHILGIIWIIRIIGLRIARNKDYEGNLNIYASDETIDAILTIAKLLSPKIVREILDYRIIFNIIEDREEKEILGCKTTFIDILTRKDKQFGFKIEISNNKYLTFLGDEPFDKRLENIVKDSEWLLHESFCLDGDKTNYKPHEKGHCTVKEASIIASSLNPKNLILWHTEDNDLGNRKELYTKEAKEYYNGNIYVPNDLEVIDL